MEEIVKDLIRDCDNIIDEIDTALKLLGSASNWGIFDIFSGGAISSYFKYKKIDDSKKIIMNLNNKMDIFKNKLEYLNRNIDLVDFSEISSLNRFLDIFMDNIFSDFLAQNSIAENKKKLNVLKSRILYIRSQLIDLK